MVACQWCQGSGICSVCGGGGMAEPDTSSPEPDNQVLSDDEATQVEQYQQERRAFFEALKPRSRRARIGVALGAVLVVAGGASVAFGLAGSNDDGPLHPVDAFNATFPTGQDANRTDESAASSVPTTTTTIPWEPQTALVKDDTYRISPIGVPEVFAELPEADRPAPLGRHWVRVRLKVESLVEDRRTQPPFKTSFGLTFPETEECGASSLSGSDSDFYDATIFEGRCTTVRAFNGELFWEGFYSNDLGIMFPPLSSGVLVLAGLFDDDQFPEDVGIGYRSRQPIEFVYPGPVPGAPAVK